MDRICPHQTLTLWNENKDNVLDLGYSENLNKNSSEDGSYIFTNA